MIKDQLQCGIWSSISELFSLCYLGIHCSFWNVEGHHLSTCGRQNNGPERHPCPTSLNLGNVAEETFADVIVRDTERETDGQKRVTEMQQEKDSTHRCWLQRQGSRFSPGASRKEHRETRVRWQNCTTARSQCCAVWGAKFAVVCCSSNGKLWHHVHFVTSWAGHLENSGSLGYVQIFPMLTWFITQSQRIINITLTSSENSLNIRKFSRTHSNYPKFSLENFYFIIGNK